MKVNITVTRSDSWIRSKRLETGQNIPSEIIVPVEVADLSIGAREVLMIDGCGRAFYPDRFAGHFSKEFQFSTSYSYGRIPLLIDSGAPTVAEIDAAIVAAANELAEKRREYEVEKIKRQAEAAEEKRREEEQKQKLAEAKALLAPQLERLEKVESDRRTLADFLAGIPDDALRGRLKAMASSPDAIEALREKVENASPVVIFGDETDDE